jgi:hypothetical protein
LTGDLAGDPFNVLAFRPVDVFHCGLGEMPGVCSMMLGVFVAFKIFLWKFRT